MKKIFDQLDNKLVYAVWGIFMLSILGSIRGCGATRENGRLRKEISDLTRSVDSLSSKVYSKEQTDIRLEILGLEVSKRILYDQNAIVRTTLRPDDRMNEYDKQMELLRKKL